MTALSSIEKKKLLIITSSGGGGLIQAANAKEQEVLAKDPHWVVVRRDTLKDWDPIGEMFCMNFWNRAQQNGKLFHLWICVNLHFFWDYVLFPFVFVGALRTFVQEDVDRIIDTQCMATSAIVKALRLFNWWKKKEIRLEKVLADLPTKKATHFFRAIKRLSPKNRRLIRLISIAPLLEEGETEEEFWQETCGLSAKEVVCEEVYVRLAFRKYKGQPRPSSPVHIRMKTNGGQELELMKRAIGRGAIQAHLHDQEVEFKILPEDRVITVLLGSQPAKQATLNYVKHMTQIARDFPHIKNHVFAFCGNHQEKEESLFQQVAAFAASLKDHPANLSIVPFSFQNESVIAPLFHRSDATCTRSGGQTAMELMCVGTGEIWVHSEAKPGQDILKGMPGWEAASASYLERLRGAKIVTTDTFIPHARALYQTHSRQSLSSRRLVSTA